MKRSHFSIDARTVLALGRDSIKDPTTAVLELVKNGYDAGATVVEIEISCGPHPSRHDYIRITDNGIGMAEDDVIGKWMRIGYSEKRFQTHQKGRRRVGEKGVGRLSADRLGAVLELRSQARDAQPVGLGINWDDFDQPGVDLAKVQIRWLDAVSFEVPTARRRRAAPEDGNSFPQSSENNHRRTGTELRIYNLRQRWAKSDLEALQKELSILTPPFGAVTDFELRLFAKSAPEISGAVESPFFEVAEIQTDFALNEAGKIRCKFVRKSEHGADPLRRNLSFDWPE